MSDTLSWVRTKEAEWFSLPPHRDSMDRESIVKFISNATVLNQLMGEGYENYAESVVEARYDDEIWDAHQLKRFTIVEYPMAVMEMMFLDKARAQLREISTGIYPLDGFNACAFRTPSGDPAVLFSEWLFAFLWDFYSEAAPLYLRGEDRELIKLEKKFGDVLVAGRYQNWTVRPLFSAPPQSNGSRWFILLAVLYILAHEVGHILLGHTDAALIASRKVDLSRGRRDSLEVYSYNHIQEFDADLFASDVYFGFLNLGFNSPINKTFFRAAHLRGFSFLRIQARLEERTLMEDYLNRNHPPSAIREAYMQLRHKDKLMELGLDVSGQQRMIEEASDQIPELDYTKDLGTDSFLG